MKPRDILKIVIITFFVLLFASGVYNQVSATEARIGLGKGITHHNSWTSQDLMLVYRNWYVQATRLGGDNRLPDTYRYSAGYRVEWRDEGRASPFLRLGVARFEDEPTNIISDKLSFDMAVGLRLYGVIDVEWQHNSTAGRSEQNYGNDLLVLGVVIPFR